MRDDRYLQRRRQYLFLLRQRFLQKPNITHLEGTPVLKRSHQNQTRFGLVFHNKHGLMTWFLRGFFNQPKPATESCLSTTYKLRDLPFPMAEEGCKLEGLGQDILHLDRRCSALSVGKIPLHGCAIKQGEEQN